MQRLPANLDPVELVKILVVGRSGVGKTHLISLLGEGLWYFTHEPDGVPVVRAQNPRARIFLLEDARDDYAKMRGLLYADHAGCGGSGCEACRYTGRQAAADGCRAVAYDSLSEAQRICLEHARLVNNKRRKNPLPEGAFDELDYNLSYQYLTRLLSMLRSVPIPLFVLAHAQEPEPKIDLPTGGTARYVRWHIPGRGFDSRIPRYFTAIGGLHHRIGPPEERAVVFDPTVLWGDRMFRVKQMAGLRPIEGVDPLLWLENIGRALRGEDLDESAGAPQITVERVRVPDQQDDDEVDDSAESAAASPAFEVPP